MNQCHTEQYNYDYGFSVGDAVEHVKGSEAGVVIEIDGDYDLGGITTCHVVWGASSLSDALAVPRDDQDIQWTNKLYKVF